MHTRYLGAAIVLAVGLAAGCAPGTPPATDSITTDADGAAPARSGDAPAMADPLSGTSWQLVQIMSMDDSTYTPDDRSLYTLEFDADGTARIRADCNRGSGTWSSASPGQLVFGAIATTRAMCPPDSLHDRYVAQFEWVRSYVMENGHLFMATMADGAIIEFEPVGGEPVAAPMPGEEVRTTDADEMRATIFGARFSQSAAGSEDQARPFQVPPWQRQEG
jgi:heat shock protein HslJ